MQFIIHFLVLSAIENKYEKTRIFDMLISENSILFFKMFRKKYSRCLLMTIITNKKYPF